MWNTRDYLNGVAKTQILNKETRVFESNTSPHLSGSVASTCDPHS